MEDKLHLIAELHDCVSYVRYIRFSSYLRNGLHLSEVYRSVNYMKIWSLAKYT